MVGLAEHHQFGAIFTVEVIEAVRPELFESALTDHPADFRFGHAAMEGRGDNDVDIVNAVVSERLQNIIEQTFANIGTAHLRQRQADVVDRNGHAHVRIELRKQRIGVERMEQRVTDGGVGIRQRIEWRRRVDHARTGGEPFEHEIVAISYQARLGAAIERHHQVAAGAGLVLELGRLQLFELRFRPRHANSFPSNSRLRQCRLRATAGRAGPWQSESQAIGAHGRSHAVCDQD